MIITIDGPGGAGKSSAAKVLARRLGFEFLDTGAMYRAVTLAALRAGLDPRDQTALARLMEGLRLELAPGRVLLDGEEVSRQIRTPEVDLGTGLIADSPVVRRRLGAMQRAVAAGRRMVCEGRDQGTVVFPEAFCKFFLSAAPEERARRWQAEMAARGQTVELAALLHALEEARPSRRRPRPGADDTRRRRRRAGQYRPEHGRGGGPHGGRGPPSARRRHSRRTRPLMPAPGWPEPLSNLWYRANHAAIFAGATLGFSFRFEGGRHMPVRGPALIVANHQSFLDPVLVGLAVGRTIHYMARKTLFDNPAPRLVLTHRQRPPGRSGRRRHQRDQGGH